ANLLTCVGPERLARFFVKRKEGWQVSRTIRESVIFSTHNLLKDPPFSNIDLVSCRNLLIYLQPAAQSRVLHCLHYALNASGRLLLGAPESLGDTADLFVAVSRSAKVFRKKPGSGHRLHQVDFELPIRRQAQHRVPKFNDTFVTTKLDALADQLFLQQHRPAGILVNQDLESMRTRGCVAPYIDIAMDGPSHNLLRMARPFVRDDLQTLLEEVRTLQEPRSRTVLRRDGDQPPSVVIEVRPLHIRESSQTFMLVNFWPQDPAEDPGSVEASPKAFGSSIDHLRVDRLEREISDSRSYLESVIREMKASNEALQVMTEELQSSNEELQITNEELGTSKEELQSTNEELTTVNDELQGRMSELAEVSDDLYNMLNDLEAPFLIVSLDLTLRHFSRTAVMTMSLTNSDRGRPVAFLNSFLQIPGELKFEQMVSDVINQSTPAEHQVRACKGDWLRMRIVPYRTVDAAIKGALVTFHQRVADPQVSDLLGAGEAGMAGLFAAIVHPLALVDQKHLISWTNSAFANTFCSDIAQVRGNPLATLPGAPWK
ncbi:MAG: hypothetical protein EOO40_05755, partial [Deltaproteobacteria bacterium]